MNGEKIGSNDEQQNESYNTWKGMADEVISQEKNDWASFESKIKNPENLATFRENMSRLDENTQSYLRELPGNIDQIFRLGKKGTDMSEKVQSEIISGIISGRYLGEDRPFFIHDNTDLHEYGTKVDDKNFHEDLKKLNEHKIDEWATDMMDINGVNYRILKDFDVNMHKLDGKTQSYILNLPSNIEQIFKKDGGLYEIPKEAREVQLEIQKNVIQGAYTKDIYGKDGYLYLAKDGGLYDGALARMHRQEDGVVSDIEE